MVWTRVVRLLPSRRPPFTLPLHISILPSDFSPLGCMENWLENLTFLGNTTVDRSGTWHPGTDLTLFVAYCNTNGPVHQLAFTRRAAKGEDSERRCTHFLYYPLECTRSQYLDAGVHLPQHEAGIPIASCKTRPTLGDSNATSIYVRLGCRRQKSRTCAV